MSGSMRNELLGYLLGALEKDEHAQVESKLAGDRALQSDADLLRKGLAPLDADRSQFEPPADLWRRTVEYVMLRAGLYGDAPPADAAVVTRPGRTWSDAAAPTRRWRMADVSVAAGILVAAMSVVVPAIVQSRANAQRIACQERLQQAYAGIVNFAGLRNGALPVASPSEGFEGKAGIYAPRLRATGNLDSDQSVICPGSELAAEEFSIPSIKELESASGQKLARLIHVMGGSYAFAIGYREDGRYRPLVLRIGSTFPLMADLPDENGRPKGHHGGCGRNVLTSDGRVIYIYARCWSGMRDKNIYANDNNEFDAGIGIDDHVILPSHFGPRLRGQQLQFRDVHR
jgi:hypothetical protein